MYSIISRLQKWTVFWGIRSEDARFAALWVSGHSQRCIQQCCTIFIITARSNCCINLSLLIICCPPDMFNCRMAVVSNLSSSYVRFTCPPALTILSLSWFVKLMMSVCPSELLIRGSHYTNVLIVWQEAFIWQLKHNQFCATVNTLSGQELEDSGVCFVLFSYGNLLSWGFVQVRDSNHPKSPQTPDAWIQLTLLTL